jgi:CHAD domain-containing protein
VRHALRTAREAVAANEAGVRAGEDDAVHQMRVTCRRLRSDVRTFRVLLDDDRIGPLRAELRWLGGALGEARDLEVLLERVDEVASRDPLCALDEAGVSAVRRLLQQREDGALVAAQEALASPRYDALLQLLSAAAAEPGLAPAAAEPCRDVLPPLVGKAWRSLARQASRLETTDPDEDWHRARILAKRARYAAEATAVALGKQARRTASAAERVQELLGEHQDAAFAANRFLELPEQAPEDLVLAVTCGRLAERERARIRAVRDAFPRTWRKRRTRSPKHWTR